MIGAVPHRTFLDIRFDQLTEAEVLGILRELAAADTFSYVVTPNVDHVVRLHQVADRQAPVWQAYAGATLSLCDSRILARLAALSGLALPVVPGSDLTPRVLADPRFAGLRCHVVGGSAETLAALQSRFPQFAWSQFVPPFNVLRDAGAQAAIVSSITAAATDLVFMAFGAPQSELVCAQVKASGAARGVALCIGASLEFVTGEKRRAPRIFQRLSLEWLFRLATEPGRLWRRYLVVGPRVFAIWARSRRN